MKICVYGLWHLGSVTAACLADLGFDVVGLDDEADVINNLQAGKAPIFEPGLDDMIKKGLANKKISFTTEASEALKDADALWIAFDTPVDEDDRADVDFVENKLVSVLGYIKNNAKVIISSQVPVGFTSKLEGIYKNKYSDRKLFFACSPENLRLGKAIKVFTEPDRIIIGVREQDDAKEFLPIFSKISDKLEWLKTESAEMTKHAINAFLATSVVFANELAAICESVGADMKEVERGLKTEERIGPKAYVRAGSPFAGGTLARDINFLRNLAGTFKKEVYLFDSVKKSNDYHKDWIKRKCLELFSKLENRKVGVLGLAYKPNTDTLRRSSSVELCNWLYDQKAIIKAFDPNVKSLPDNLSSKIELKDNLENTISDLDCLIVATEHSNFRDLTDSINAKFKDKIVIDPNGFLEKNIKSDVKYIVVGRNADEIKKS